MRAAAMPSASSAVDLILHQRDERRDDDGHTVEQERRQLVAEALAEPGREHRQRAAARKQRLDHLGLPRAKRTQAEALGEQAARALARRWQGDGEALRRP